MRTLEERCEGLGSFHKSRVLMIGQERETKAWEVLCDTFQKPFRSREAIAVLAVEMSWARKTAADYWNALQAFWLHNNNSDLVKIRNGLYFWKDYETDA